MAKKKATEGVNSLFKRTEPPAKGSRPGTNADLNEGVIRSVSVGLKTGEIDALEAIAKDEKLARNALLRIIIREWIIKYRRGEVDVSQFREVREVVKVRFPE